MNSTKWSSLIPESRPPKLDANGNRVANTFTVTVAADVPAGLYDVRVRGLFGISNPRMFRVDSLPEIAEVEPNNFIGSGHAGCDGIDRQCPSQRYGCGLLSRSCESRSDSCCAFWKPRKSIRRCNRCCSCFRAADWPNHAAFARRKHQWFTQRQPTKS